MKTRNILLLAMGTALMAGLPSVAHSGNYQVYGSEWAVNNDYNASGQIGCSFGSGSSPSLTAWFNFSDSSKIWGYPACIRGYHYGQNPAGDTLFPFQVSSKSSIPCNFSYSAGDSSMSGDFAYDMFLRWDSQVAYPNDTPQCEVMVWPGGGSWPLGNCTATYAVYTANTWFDLWEGYNSGAGYYVYTFIPNGKAGAALPTSGSLNVDMKVFFNWLQSNRSGSGYYNDSMYLDVIEAGYEIVKGNSWIWIQGDFNATTGSGGGSSSGSTYKLIARHSGKALDASGYGTSNGTQIQQWTYVSGANQKWTVTDSGNGNYKIIGVQSGKSLDIDYSSGGTANGTKVQLWDYWNGASQQYKFAATDSGYYRITPNCATGSCLDVSGVSTANGAKVQLWQWGGGANQQWSFQAP